MTFTTGGATWSSDSNFTLTWVQPPPDDDDGLAGVREPRRPLSDPPCLVASREPDGSWYIPLPEDPRLSARP